MAKLEASPASFAKHLAAGKFTGAGQRVSVGMRPALDGAGMFAVLRIEGCVDQAEGEWLGDKVAEDLRAWLMDGLADPVVSQEVSTHCWQPDPAAGWTVAIGVEGSRERASEVAAWFRAYVER